MQSSVQRVQSLSASSVQTGLFSSDLCVTQRDRDSCSQATFPTPDSVLAKTTGDGLASHTEVLACAPARPHLSV